MREIKFRAWDELNKIMYLDVDFIRSGDGNNDWIVFQSRGKPFDFDNPNPYFRQQIKIMEYSGLKDKNGVEIYEGDIVDFASRFDNSKRTGKVVYYAGDAAFLIEDEKEIFFLFYDALEREVIGNIYENPELLNKR